MNTPDIRFAGFTGAWEQRRLEEVSEIVRGASPRPIKDPRWFDDNSDVGWLRISDVTEQDGRVHFLEQRISEAGQEMTRVLTEPHLLLSIAATVGKPVINYVKTGVHDGFLIFQSPNFDREFMFQWLEMFRPKWQRFGQPGSQVNLNSDLVKSKDIMLPCEAEQTRIGSFFATLDRLITLHQREYDKTVNIKKAMLVKMFPKEGADRPEIRFAGFTDAWEQRRLGDVCTTFADGDWIEAKDQSNSGIRLLQTGNIGVNEYLDKPDRAKWISEDTFVRLNCTNVFPGDILISRLPEPAGRACIVPNTGQKMITAVDCTIVRTSENCISEYLVQYLSAEPYFKDVNDFLAGGTRQRISRSNLSKFIIPLPSVAEQRKIGELFTSLCDLITLHQREFEKLQNMKKALLEKMFV
jgi:type I restriction enzyme S subunit